MKTNRNWMKRAAMLSAMAACALGAQSAFAAKDDAATGADVHLEDAASLKPTPMSRVKATPKTSADTYEATGDLGITMSHGQTITLHFDINKAYTRITSARLVMHMWDVDYPSATEQDNVYFNGTYLGRLEGLNNGWDYNYFDVPISKITVPSSGESVSRNTVTINVSVDPSGWVTQCGSAQLIINGDTFSLTASRNIAGGISVNWDNVCGSYDLWRKGPDDSDFTRIRQGITTNGCFDTDVQIGKPYTYYAIQSGAKSGVAKDATPNGASNTDEGLAGQNDFSAIMTKFGYIIIGVTTEASLELKICPQNRSMYKDARALSEAIKGSYIAAKASCNKLNKEFNPEFTLDDNSVTAGTDGTVSARYKVSTSHKYFDVANKPELHGEYSWKFKLICLDGREIQIRNAADGSESFSGSKDGYGMFNIYFKRDMEVKDKNGKYVPAWFEYWKASKDGTCSELTDDIVYDDSKCKKGGKRDSLAFYDQPDTKKIYFSADVVNIKETAYHISGVSQTLHEEEVCDNNPLAAITAQIVAAHEKRHRFIHNIYSNDPSDDSDSDWVWGWDWKWLRPVRYAYCDSLSDNQEYFWNKVYGLQLDVNKVDTYNLAKCFPGGNYDRYGDNELLARIEGGEYLNGKGVVRARDFAYPGMQLPLQSKYGVKAKLIRSAGDMDDYCGGTLSEWPVDIDSDKTEWFDFSMTSMPIAIHDSVNNLSGASFLRFPVVVSMRGLEDATGVITNDTDAITVYLVKGYLADANGTPVAWTISNVEFTNTTVNVDIDFDGASIYSSHRSGFSLKALEIFTRCGDVSMLLGRKSNLGSTDRVYTYSEFANSGMELLANESGDSVSPDGLNVDLTFENATTDLPFVFEASLSATNGNEIIARATTTNVFSTSSGQAVRLAFPKSEIAASGIDGQYRVSSMTVSATGTVLTTYVDIYTTTNSYRAVDFLDGTECLSFIEGSAAFLSPAVAADGKLGKLPFVFSVMNGDSETIECQIAASLCTVSNKLSVATTLESVKLTNGMNEVSLSFSSSDIAAYGYDGPYKVEITVSPTGSKGNRLRIRPDVVTGEYKADDFGKSPVELVGTPLVNTSGSAPVVTLSVEGLRDCVYNASAVLLDSNREFVAYVVTTNTIAAGVTNTVTMAFDEAVIIASGHRGPYILDYVMLEPQNGADAAKLYSGAAVSDIDYTVADAYVDAVNGSDSNGGTSWSDAYQTIQAAVNVSMSGDTILVADGTYAPFQTGNKEITIMSRHGAASTIIDGGGTNRCATLGTSAGHTNTVLRGFTLTAGKSYNGGGAMGGTLVNCMLIGNVAEFCGGGAYYSLLENTCLNRNKAFRGGGCYFCTGYNITVCGNKAKEIGGVWGGDYYNAILRYNGEYPQESNCLQSGSYYLCCTYPNIGSGSMVNNPMLVDGWNGDARLRVGSPCIVDGVQVCGAYVGEPVEGVSVSVGVQGAGAVSNETILVTSGGNATIESVETVRPFLYWRITDGNGMVNTSNERVHTIENITGDLRAVAVFGSYDWYVDAEYGDDANDGSDWDAAKRTLQSAVSAAVDDETIYVEAGTYGPISTDNKRIHIESMNGAEMTFIDGGGMNRCATLGDFYQQTDTVLIGFTLINGRATQYGGGSYGGTMECCIISNCLASGYGDVCGGGAYYGRLNNCLVAYNVATSSNGRAYGGGGYGSTLSNCTVVRNRSQAQTYAYGGGLYGNTWQAYNSIIWGNFVNGGAGSYGMNSRTAWLYYCCTDADDADRSYRTSGSVITNDPQFVDADAGDFHLMVGSPCVNTGYDWYVQGDMDLDWDDRIQGAAVDMGCYEGAEYAAPPGRVTGLHAVRGVLTWDAMSDAEGFMVYRSTRRAASSAKYIGMAGTNTYTDETAVEGTTYYYWVTAFNTLGMGARSDVTENTWPEPLSIATTELPNGRVHDEYSVQLQATGGGLPYSWEAVTPGYAVSSNASTFAATGTAKGWRGDNMVWWLDLPFDFPFYGKSYRGVHVDSNGGILFEGNDSGPMIYVLWSDLATNYDGCDIFVAVNENSVTIRWKAMYHNSDELVNVSATLYADGRIVLSYGGGNAYGGMCGISAGDDERYLIVRDDSSSWSNAKDIVFEAGGYEASSIDLPDGITLSADGVLSGVAAESGTFNVYVRVTDVIGDSAVAEFPLLIEKNPITFYVDAANGDDANDGLSAESAKCTLQSAIAASMDDDTIIVAAGTYRPIASNNKRIRVESVSGPTSTFIDGGGTNRCAVLGQVGVATATNSVLSGFTLMNGFNSDMGGAVCGGTLKGCILRDSRSSYNGGATYYSNLERCILTNNTAKYTGGGSFYGTLRNCLIVGNTSGNAGGGVSLVNAYNCTIVGNQTVQLDASSQCRSGGSYRGVCYNSIVWDNRDAYGNIYNYNDTVFYYSCTLPEGGTRCITNDPQFVDSANGDYRLAAGSPCLNVGDNSYVLGAEDLAGNARIIGAAVDLGCCEGAVYSALPGIVTDVRALRGVVTWTADLMSQEYEILRSATDDVSAAVVVATAYGTEWTDDDAGDMHLYWYWVRGKNPLGTGAIGNAAQMSWPGPLAIATENLPAAMEMVEYSAQLEATGGVAPYSWCSPAGGYSVTTNSTSTFAEVGTAKGWHADDSYWTLELPFDFPLFGNKYSTAYVNSNGMISFGDPVDDTSYSDDAFLSNPIVSVLWKDLRTDGSRDIYVYSDSSSVTIRWKAVYYDGGSDVNASISLYPDGSIKFAYGSGNVNGGFVGVSAGDGENFIVIDGTYSSLDNAPDIVLKQSSLPGGFSLSDDGEITGTPMAAGTNTFTVTVTDALGDTDEKELTIVVNENPNHKPVIDAVSPMTNVYVKVGNSATFAVTAHDPEGAALEYAWYLDGEEIECIANSYTFTATLDDAGAHTLECVVSDGLWTDMVRHTWSFRVVRDWYVDASAEDDSGDGSSADSALYSISEAVWYAEDGDTIYVAPGTYEDYLEFYSDRTVSIVATGGASCTFFTGQIDGYSTEWYSGSMVIQSSMIGFTFRGCYLNGTTLHVCVLTCDETGCYPSEAYGCRLFDCSVTGNTSDYTLIEQSELTRCTVAGNTVGEYGAVGYSSCVYDSIVWGNVTTNGEPSNYDSEMWWDYDNVAHPEVEFEHSCTFPMPLNGADNNVITSDPRLVDAANGDLRLRVGSPCLVGGVQTMGVCLGEPVAGFVLSVRIEGSGAVSPMTAVVSNGGNATFEVADNTRPFLGFSTNGVFATAADTLTWQGVKSDGIITAAFSNFTFYVDAATGDDANDGLSCATARASIQSAIDDAARGEIIYVKAGTYDPIVVGAAMRLRIESVDGKEATVIDGGGERQCANLGGNDSFSSTLVGFTLTNGYSNYGGGATGGKLVDCDVIGNTATYRGGGLNYSTAIRCRIMDNVVSPQWRNDGYGGGAYGGTLINSLVINNVVDETSYYGYGGGTSQSYLYNCTVVGNEAHGMYYVYGGGVQSGGLYNTIVFGNSLVAEDEDAYTYGEDVYNNGWNSQYNCLVGEDPGFVDEMNGDYRLAADSPCIDAGGNGYVMEDTDLDGNARIQHYTVDIGCYEYELATPERDADADFAAQMAGTCYGVFVGVGRYTYTSSLTGPTIDATNMQARCIAKGYWRDENTVAFLDAAATKSVVRARLATLAAKAVSGDTVLYYQSSHGGNNYDQYGNMTKDTCICLHDETYEDYEMAEDMMQFAAGVKVVIVLDTCHSAGMFKAVKGTSHASTKSFALRVRELMSERAALRKGAKSGIATDDIGWIAAADYNQYSYDSPRGGAFTVALLDGWKTGAADYDGDKRLNFHELWRYAKGIAVGYGGSDASDAQCLNENVLLSRFAGAPDSSGNGNTTETTPAPVEHVWLDAYPEVLAAFGGDYEAMASAPSPGASGGGKTWPDGSPYYVWQDFVAGTSPTNDTVFTATIRMEGNTPVVTWEPDTPELRATRVYRTLGKKTLLDANWTDITDKDQSEYHFFRVTVDMP